MEIPLRGLESLLEGLESPLKGLENLLAKKSGEPSEGPRETFGWLEELSKRSEYFG